MTYQEFINGIIESRGQFGIPENEYYERHHIIPECMGGLGDRNTEKYHENFIWLYPQEHYEAHKLLALENPQNEKLVCAWNLMCHRYDKNSGDYIQVSAEDFAMAKQLWYEYMNGVNDPRSKQVICLETCEAFLSLKAAAEFCGGSSKNIGQVCRGEKHTHKGYHWAFYDKTVNTPEKCAQRLENEKERWDKAHHSDVIRKHMQDLARKRKGSIVPSMRGENNPRSKSCVDLTANIVYGSLAEAARSVNGTVQGIYDACTGRSHSHRNHKFAYYTKEN